MSKAVLISVRPKWCELIADGKKTIEVRKTLPKIPTPFQCYIYCTKDQGNEGSATHFYESDNGTFSSDGKTFAAFLSGTVIGEFVCDRMDTLSGRGVATEEYLRDACLTVDQYNAYRKGRVTYFWHISNLVIYDESKKLSDFRLYNTSAVIEHGLPMPTHEIKRPPQSWCYVEELT